MNSTLASVSPAVAVPIVGASGTDTGVTGLLAADAGLSPTLLLATMVKVYSVPLLRPVTVQGVLVQLLEMLSGALVAV